MDAACYNTTDGAIYAVRGGRVFKIDAATGNIVTSKDYNPRLLSGASIAYASANNTLWAGGWNDQTSNQTVGNAIPSSSYFCPRSLHKIDPTSLNVIQNFDLDSFFPSALIPNLWDSKQYIQAGIRDMRSVGNRIFASIDAADGGFVNVSNFQLMVDPTNVATYTLNNQGATAGQPAVISQNEVWVPDTSFPGIQQVDTSGSFTPAGSFLSTWNGGPAPSTANTWFPIAVEWSPEAGALFTTSQDVGSPGDGSWIYRCSTAPAEVLRFNIGRTAFNGIRLRRCPIGPNVGKLYAAGFGDNTVCVITPTNAFTIKTGFDLPIDFVFTPSKVWAVQQGSIPLKEVV